MKTETIIWHRIVALIVFVAIGQAAFVSLHASEDEATEVVEEEPVDEVIAFPDYGATPMNSIGEGHAKLFRLPAPRGMITSRGGEPLAVTKVAKRVVASLPQISSSREAIVEALRVMIEDLEAASGQSFPAVKDRDVTAHFDERPWIPFPISGILAEDALPAIREGLPESCSLETVYVRHYPEGPLTAHLTGYVGVSVPDQHGPVGKVEYAWPPTAGRAGLEKELDEQLQGTEGEISRLFSDEGELLNVELGRSPRPGKTVVTSINLPLQRLALERLKRTGRPGAFVAVDADTGDILAMVSNPTFDPNAFVPVISPEKYTELQALPDAPFFDRAVMGQYPPGSTFKPFVLLAGLEWGRITGKTRYPGPPVLLVGGRPFKNWHGGTEGEMDLRYALTRSCNTWFYQAGNDMGAHAITDISHRFGLGYAPLLPLPAVSGGKIPEPDGYNDPKSLANYSIGQGEVLVSPLQLALAMAGLANGKYVPKPRLILGRQDPFTGQYLSEVESQPSRWLNLDPEEVELVREGMWGAVNHRRGTAKVASLRKPVVYGKTGTAQWATGGRMRYLAWFTGWVDATEPRIAFVALSQGRAGQMLSGGRSAAPIAAGVLRGAYGDPDLYAVTVPEKPSRPTPRLIAASIVEPIEIETAQYEFGRGVGGFFRNLFGGRRRAAEPPPPPPPPSLREYQGRSIQTYQLQYGD